MARLMCRLEGLDDWGDVLTEGPELGIDAVLLTLSVKEGGRIHPSGAVALLRKQQFRPLLFALELEIEAALSPSEEFGLVQNISSLLRHSQYLTVNRFPVIVLGKIWNLSHPTLSLQRIKQVARTANRGNPPLIFSVWNQPSPPGIDTSTFPEDLDGTIENAWKCIPCSLRGDRYDYDSFLYHAHHRKPTSFLVVPAVHAPTADDDSRFIHASASSYREWLDLSRAWIDIRCNGSPDALCLVESWPGHRRWGRRASPSVSAERSSPASRTISTFNDSRRGLPGSHWGTMGSAAMAVLVHGFHLDTLVDLMDYLKMDHAVEVDIYLATPFEHTYRAEQILRRSNTKTARIFGVPNRGRDVASFVEYLLPACMEDGHQYFLKIHTKKSLHLDIPGKNWARSIYDSLLKPENLSILYRHLEDHPTTGIAAAPGSLLPTSVCLARNSPHLLHLMRLFAVDGPWFLHQSFVAGSMFAGRVKALESVVSALPLLPPFEAEAGQTDGTLAHALERLMCVFAVQAGYDVSEVMMLPSVTTPSFGFEFAKPLAPSGCLLT